MPQKYRHRSGQGSEKSKPLRYVETHRLHRRAPFCTAADDFGDGAWGAPHIRRSAPRTRRFDRNSLLRRVFAE